MSNGNGKSAGKRQRPTGEAANDDPNQLEHKLQTKPEHNSSAVLDATTSSPSRPENDDPTDVESLALVHPKSPASNRERFHASCMPNTITCDLSTVSTQPGMKFSFSGIVLVVYPASNNPLRRHILLGDGRGTVGVTVWHTQVSLFSSQTVGQLAQFTKVALSSYNNTRGLVLNKESAVTLATASQHFASMWWQSLLLAPPVQAIFFHDTADNSIVNVAGIIGSVTKEDKTVRNAPASLLTVRLVDRTGVIMVRSWTHSHVIFEDWVDKPILIRRVRVTAFANIKIGELLDGDGSHFEREFDNHDLIKFWAE
jgi:hypothetical protein